MRILSKTNDIKGYHGTIGTPTNMYDYRGEQLFVGDVVWGMLTQNIIQSMVSVVLNAVV